MTFALVTAYYPLPEKKHSDAAYDTWIHIFFACVTCKVFVFCPQEIADKYTSIAGENVTFLVRPFESFTMMSPEYMQIWKQFHEIDPERGHHNPNLYAIWAAKQEFVCEVIREHKFDTYVWCDIGCFRTPRCGSFEYVEQYCVPHKITCLYLPQYDTIGGGVLVGDARAWLNFATNYLKHLHDSPHGKDQVIYRRFIHTDNANIIVPSFLSYIPNYDPWFHLTYIFSYPVQT
jgi:hypothetical protein